MQTPNRLLIIVTLLALTTLASVAQEPATAPPISPPAPPLAPALPGSPGDHEDFEASRAREKMRQVAAKWSVRLDVQMVGAPQELALKLLPDLMSNDKGRVEKACNQIQEMIRTKQATLLGWPFLVMLDGDRAVCEAIDEKRYPTEFDPPQEPSGLGTGTTIKDGPGERNVALVPNAFETRNVGTTLEAEVTVADDGRRLIVNLAPQRVVLQGWQKYETGHNKKGTTALTEQPQFTTSKTTSVVSLGNGERMLLAVHQHDSSPDTIELHILHAVATRVDR